MKTKTFPIVVQEWLESEAGWGCRPDGYSIHLTEADRVRFCKEYWDSKPKLGYAPHEYSREDGPPIIVDITAKAYEKLQEEPKIGWRLYSKKAIDDLRPSEVVQKEEEEKVRMQKAYSAKIEKEWEAKKEGTKLVYGEDYDINRGWH